MSKGLCPYSCALAFGFLGCSLSIFLSTRKDLLANQFADSLDQKQKEIYFQVVNERFNNYTRGTILGIVLGALFLAYAQRNGIDKSSTICGIILIIGISQYIVYKFTPKSVWMLNYLEKREQIDAWLEIYKYMSYRCHIGFIVGLIGYGFLANI